MRVSKSDIKRWEGTGFIENVPEEHKATVVEAFEELVRNGLNEFDKYSVRNEVEIIIWPILLRVLEAGDWSPIKVKNFVGLSIEIVKSDEYKTLKSELEVVRPKLDVECQMTDFIVDKITNRKNGM